MSPRRLGAKAGHRPIHEDGLLKACVDEAAGVVEIVDDDHIEVAISKTIEDCTSLGIGEQSIAQLDTRQPAGRLLGFIGEVGRPNSSMSRVVTMSVKIVDGGTCARHLDECRLDTGRQRFGWLQERSRCCWMTRVKEDDDEDCLPS